VMCCVTIHYLLPKLPDDLKAKVISLLDVLFDLVEASDERHLVVCSTGTQKLKILQNHPRWDAAKDRLVFPGIDDQETIHHLIYGIKQNRGMKDIILCLESLLKLHEVDSFLVACSDIHMVAKQFSCVDNQRGQYSCLDPLAVIARDCAEGRLWTAKSD
jgi:aspartate racemase